MTNKKKSQIIKKKDIDKESQIKIESTLDFVHTILNNMSQYCNIERHTGNRTKCENISTKEVINLETDLIETKAINNNLISTTECSICFFKRKMTRYKCGHEICLKCANRWNKIKKSCPICRTYNI